jgi:D-alanyl-D-alanine carboxypeptidase/D-alanyl-D-alanine-endopeptidase (penicillin-binding protein 4)
MRANLFQVLALTAVTVLPAAAATHRPGPVKDLKQRLHQIIFNANRFAPAHVGCFVEVLKSGRVVFSESGTRPMIPASNLKVVTTATAVDELGPNFRYQTELRGGMPDAHGVLRGNLYLQGSGDPSICLPYTQPATTWRFFVAQLKKRGVKEIEGDLVGDDSDFDREWLGKGWFDRYRLDGYSAPVSALSCNKNVVEMTLTSRGISLDPPSLGFPVLNKMHGGGQPYIDRKANSQQTIAAGGINPGAVVKREVTVANPGLFTVGALASVLIKSGIKLDGHIRLIKIDGEPALCRQAPIIARYQSPVLQEIITQTNRESDNMFAQHIFKTLGQHAFGLGSVANGQAAVISFLRRNNIDPTGLHMVDGCGLSVLDRVSPSQLVGILEAMWRSPGGQVFMDSLPAPGQGTLSGRLGGVNLRAKTGTLDKDSSLTGYVVTSFGQTVGFSVLANDVPSVGWAMDLEDRVVHTIAAWNQPL